MASCCQKLHESSLESVQYTSWATNPVSDESNDKIGLYPSIAAHNWFPIESAQRVTNPVLNEHNDTLESQGFINDPIGTNDSDSFKVDHAEEGHQKITSPQDKQKRTSFEDSSGHRQLFGSESSEQCICHTDDFNSVSADFVNFKGGGINRCVSIFSDEEELRNAVPWVLQLLGCHKRKTFSSVSTVVSASVAKELQTSDLVFCDIGLGLSCISAMREVADGMAIPPVVLIVEKTFDKELLSKCLEAGADSYVVKPLRIQALRGLVQKYMCDDAPDWQQVREDVDAALEKGTSGEVYRASYETTRCIGSGAAGEVWLVKRKRDGAKFALKEINISKMTAFGQQRILNEIRLHRSFSCPCIVRTYSSWLQENSAYLLMEYIKHGSLRDLVQLQKQKTTRIEDASTTEWGAQILLAILYLHNKGVLHRDLKLENILGPDNDKCVKLTDFGVSKQMQHQAEATAPLSPMNLELSMVGTVAIMSPERVVAPSAGGFRSGGDGRESDLWSFGVVLYELITLKPPFGEVDVNPGVGEQRETLFESISTKSPEPLPYDCDAGLHKIVIGGLLQKNPKDRPTASELCKDPTLGKAMLFFLKRMKLLNHPAVLEVLDVNVTLNNLGQKTDRIECPNLDAVSLYAQRTDTENSRLGRELLSRASGGGTKWEGMNWERHISSRSNKSGNSHLARVREDVAQDSKREVSMSLADAYGDQITGIENGIEEQLTQMTRTCDQLREDIEQHKVELRYLRRPVEAAQRQSDLIAAYVQHTHDGILHPWSLRFVKDAIEVEYALARRQRVASRIAVVGILAVGACVGRLAVGEQPSWLGSFAGELAWHTQQLFLCGALGSSLVAIMCALVILRKVRRMLFACELLATLLLNISVLALILVHDPLYSLALSELITLPIRSPKNSLCADVCREAIDADEELPVRMSATAILAIVLALTLLPVFVPVRYVVQLVVFIVLIPICTVAEFAAESTLSCRSSSDGGASFRLTLLCAVIATALYMRRHSDRAERFQCLLTGKDSNAKKKDMPDTPRSRQGTMKMGSKTFSRTFSSMSTDSGAKRNWFAAAAKGLSSSAVSLGEKNNIRRSVTSNSEAIFQAYEEADDEVTRAISLVSIEERGFKERWLLDSESVRISPNCQLGTGGFGVVLEGELYGSPIALKLPKQNSEAQSDRASQRHRNNLGNELRVLRHVWHPNIVVFYGCTIDLGSQEIMIILELLKGEPLDDFCCRRERPPSTAMRHKLALDICSALCSLHSLNPRVVHGDLKGSNILVELWDSGPRAKLLDFGLSRLLTSNVSPLGGTVRWMAPEVIRRRTDPLRAPAADIFSFGRLAFLIVTGRQPLRDYSCEAIVQAVQRSQVLPLNWPRTGPLVNECKPLAERCLMMQAYMRPDMQTVLHVIKAWSVPQDTGRRVSIHGSTMPIAPRPQSPCVDWEDGIGFVISQARSQEGTSSKKLESLRRRFLGTHNDRDADFMSTLMKEVSSHGRLIEPSRIKLMIDQIVNTETNANILVPGELDGYLTALRVPRTCLSASTAESVGLDLIKLELQALLHVKHPNIVAFHGLCFAHEYCCIIPVVEWVEGISLEHFSKPPPEDPDEGTRLRVLLDISSALLYLHSREPSVVHGGLNCNNVLVEARIAGPRAKILDVGIARTLGRYSKRSSWMPKDVLRKRRKRMDFSYTAPELLYHRKTIQHFDTSADLFSLGRLCYLVVCGKAPFEGVDTPILERAAQRFEVVPLIWPEQPVPLQRKCRNIVERCLSLHKVARPDIRDLQKDMTHWLGDDDLKGLEALGNMDMNLNTIVSQSLPLSSEAQTEAFIASDDLMTLDGSNDAVGFQSPHGRPSLQGRTGRSSPMGRLAEEPLSPEATVLGGRDRGEQLPTDREMPSTPQTVPKIEFTTLGDHFSEFDTLPPDSKLVPDTLPPVRLVPDVHLMQPPSMKADLLHNYDGQGLV